MNYEMGRDIGMVLEDLSPFDFEAVRPRLNISFETNEAKRKAEDRQYELDYNIDHKTHKYRKSALASLVCRSVLKHEFERNNRQTKLKRSSWNGRQTKLKRYSDK